MLPLLCFIVKMVSLDDVCILRDAHTDVLALSFHGRKCYSKSPNSTCLTHFLPTLFVENGISQHIPFTVFTKTCFSLVGSFSSSSSPWKMRPKVPDRDKTRGFQWERGGQRRRIHRLKGHLAHRLICRQSVDASLPKTLCLYLGIKGLWLELSWKLKNWIFHHLGQCRNAHAVARRNNGGKAGVVGISFHYLNVTSLPGDISDSTLEHKPST